MTAFNAAVQCTLIFDYLCYMSRVANRGDSIAIYWVQC